MFGFLFFWFLCGVVGMIVGINKKAGGCSVAASPFLGPIGLLSAVMWQQPRCPYCKENIQKDAKVCPHCKKDL